jgi:hypothetical protein
MVRKATMAGLMPCCACRVASCTISLYAFWYSRWNSGSSKYARKVREFTPAAAAACSRVGFVSSAAKTRIFFSVTLPPPFPAEFFRLFNPKNSCYIYEFPQFFIVFYLNYSGFSVIFQEIWHLALICAGACGIAQVGNVVITP